jgi:hypothetical protein
MAQFHHIVMPTAINVRLPVLPPNQPHALVKPATRIPSSTNVRLQRVVLAHQAEMIIVLVERDIGLMDWHRMIQTSLGWLFLGRSTGCLLRQA